MYQVAAFAPKASPAELAGALGTASAAYAALGVGTMYHETQTRPRWIITYNPAQATANKVMASAKRLIELRHA